MRSTDIWMFLGIAYWRCWRWHGNYYTGVVWSILGKTMCGDDLTGMSFECLWAGDVPERRTPGDFFEAVRWNPTIGNVMGCALGWYRIWWRCGYENYYTDVVGRKLSMLLWMSLYGYRKKEAEDIAIWMPLWMPLGISYMNAVPWRALGMPLGYCYFRAVGRVIMGQRPTDVPCNVSRLISLRVTEEILESLTGDVVGLLQGIWLSSIYGCQGKGAGNAWEWRWK